HANYREVAAEAWPCLRAPEAVRGDVLLKAANDMEVVVLRPARIFGLGEEWLLPRLVSELARGRLWLPAAGNAEQTFVAASDVGRQLRAGAAGDGRLDVGAHRHRHAARRPTHLSGLAMKALVKSQAAPGLWLEDVPQPQPGPGEVLIRVLRTGICGTDLHIDAWNEWAQHTIKPGLVVGHEFVGEVVELGEDVASVYPGEIVGAEGHIVCGRCRNCMAGRRA